MKKTLALILALLMVLALAACGEKAPEANNTPAAETNIPQELIDAAKAEGELVVYGSCEEDYLNAACDKFEELYGIKVNRQRLSTGEVPAKIEEENGNPSADVWLAAPTTPMIRWVPRASWMSMRLSTTPT